MDVAKHFTTKTQSELDEIIDDPKTPPLRAYQTQVAEIQNQIGDLESVRLKLGLSARKMGQLLLVDPSAWTRWKKGEGAPPHVWRALQWYMILQEKIPGLTAQYFLGGNSEDFKRSLSFQFSEVEKQGLALKKQNQDLELKIAKLESAVSANRGTAVVLGLATIIMGLAFLKIMLSRGN